jgi:hypothetical protein
MADALRAIVRCAAARTKYAEPRYKDDGAVGSVRKTQRRHQQMQREVRPMPRATCCKKEINRRFSTPFRGQATGGDSHDSVTVDGRHFFATPSPKACMKTAECHSRNAVR